MKDDVAASTGSVYTPKDVVLYTVRNAVTQYLELQGLPEKTAFDLVHHKKIGSQFATDAERFMQGLTLIDCCSGSGAFQFTALCELFEMKREIRIASGKTRWTNGDQRRAYEDLLKRNIFGMDINPEAIILCHLRLWLPIINLIENVKDYDKIDPLPNLTLNIRCGNSIINEMADWESPNWTKNDYKRCAQIRDEYFSAKHNELPKLKSEFDNITNQDDSYVRLSRNFIDITKGGDGGFSVIVGNPPYLGLKDTKEIQYIQDWHETNPEKEIADMYSLLQ